MSQPSNGIAVLSADPGFADFGYAVVLHGAVDPIDVLHMGVITTKPDKRKGRLVTEDQFSRLQTTCEAILKLVSCYDVRALCFESLSIPQKTSKQNAIKIGFSYAMLAMLATEHHLPAVMVSPRDVKLANTGVVKSSKEDVQTAVANRFAGFREVERFSRDMTAGKQNHGWDALATYVASSRKDVMKALVAHVR